MTVLNHTCPYCEAPMRTATMECPLCAVEVRGTFRTNLFDMLSPEEQELLEQYLLAEFSLKKLSERTQMGYLALRTRVDRLIAHYRAAMDQESRNQPVLDGPDKGELSAGEARKRLVAVDGNERT